MSYLLTLPKIVDKQYHQVVIGYRVLVGEDWPAEFDDQVIVFIDSDFHNLGGHVGTSIFGSLVPSIAMVVLLCKAFGAAAIFGLEVPIIALGQRVAFAIATGLQTRARRAQIHVTLIIVFTELTLLDSIKVHPILTGGTPSRLIFAS